MPVITRYLERLETRLSGIGLGAGTSPDDLLGKESSLLSLHARSPCTSLNRAGGWLIAAAHLGQLAGIQSVISFDMAVPLLKRGWVERGIPKIGAFL